MLAAVCRKPGEPLVMEEIMVAPPMGHEVRIRIICTSLCHSDLIVWKMKVLFGILIFNHSSNFSILYSWNRNKNRNRMKQPFFTHFLIFTKDPPGIVPRILGHEAIGWVSTYIPYIITFLFLFEFQNKDFFFKKKN